MPSQLKYLCVGLISCLFAGCAISPADRTVINSNATYYSGRNVASNNCPKCIAQMREIKGTRLVEVKITTNAPLKEISYSALPTSSTVHSTVSFKRIPLPKNGFDGIIRVPENTPIFIGASALNDATQDLSGSTLIKPTESSVVVNFEVRDFIPLLKNDFKKLNRNEQKKLMEIITLYDVAISSPKMLFSARKAEADGAFSLFYMDASKSFKDSRLSSYIQNMRMGLDHLDSFGTDPLNSIGKIAVLKKII